MKYIFILVLAGAVLAGCHAAKNSRDNTKTARTDYHAAAKQGMERTMDNIASKIEPQ